MPVAARPSSVDLFCRVVDNFGDIGVCWRLARQLTAEEGIPVRLIVDRLEVAQVLVPGIDSGLDVQCIEGVVLHRWLGAGLRCEADLVIEAFACELPEDYLANMTARSAPPVWINLEYLSAEPWVASHHGLPSPHPRLHLTKHFFFPGFFAGTGGLLRERHTDRPVPVQPAVEALRIYAFTYDTDSIDALCRAISIDGRMAAVRFAGRDSESKLQHWRGVWNKTLPEAAPVLEFAEFVPQDRFDHVLAAHDLLLVRGEDSLVRALWSGRPFVWQLYRQPEDAHLSKLIAFAQWYAEGMALALAESWLEFSIAWNRADPSAIAATWPQLRDHWDAWVAHAHKRATAQMREPDLVSNLLSFFGKLARM